MPTQQLLLGLGAFVIAFFIGTLVEYGVHRLMHKGMVLAKIHANHHRDGWGQGWLKEFWDYLSGTSPLIIVGSFVAWHFLDWPGAAVGWAAGGVLYAVLAAYAHQVQHERPELVFWLRSPVHHLHHEQKMWNHNFGILVDFWDRVFGTYKPVEWKPEKRPFDYPLRSFLQIRWVRPPAPAEGTTADKVLR
jgi:sterol desaturase/sphingolipid hydroxylase (fatty acid hydroxylase superfamily)